MTIRSNLHFLKHRQFISDGGLETTLLFENGIDLPEFAAFPLLEQSDGIDLLRDYYLRYIYLAKKNHCGFILESPTWRASRVWGEKLGYGPGELDRINTRAIEFLADLRDTLADRDTPMMISGCLGPQGDGYHVDNKLSIEEARAYHLPQIRTFSRTNVDLISAMTLNYSEEASGITLAAGDVGVPAVISFTVETDGRLPSGQPLGDAILEVDRETGGGPLYYMINCSHPSHFRHVLTSDSVWRRRIKAIRANASCKSHAELDQLTELDKGDPVDLGRQYKELTTLLPELNIFGGCCGTDHHHVEAICREVIHVH
ncbi:MAG: homocysteine S-methyltransferase family protein [Desulfofustis sp.]|nr:homocysteine S-methyltransferase family protein [Desulfofustis sp.]